MNKKPIILGVLLALAAAMVIRAVFFSSMTPPVPPPTPAAGNAEAGAPATATADASAGAAAAAPAGAPATAPAPPKVKVNLDQLSKNVQVVDFQYTPATLARNPMGPLVGPQAVLAAANAAAAGDAAAKPGDAELLTQQMAVTGIVWDKKFPVAVINNDVVAPGDVLGAGIVVKAIESDKVILAVNDRPVTLQLKHLEEQ